MRNSKHSSLSTTNRIWPKQENMLAPSRAAFKKCLLAFPAQLWLVVCRHASCQTRNQTKQRKAHRQKWRILLQNMQTKETNVVSEFCQRFRLRRLVIITNELNCLLKKRFDILSLSLSSIQIRHETVQRSMNHSSNLTCSMDTSVKWSFCKSKEESTVKFKPNEKGDHHTRTRIPVISPIGLSCNARYRIHTLLGQLLS